MIKLIQHLACLMGYSCVQNNETLWYEDDKVVTLVPKFKIKEGMEEPYTALLPKFIDLVKENEGESCIHYGFVGPTEDGYVICREGYTDADGLLYHLENVGDVLNEALQYADIVELQVGGPASELEKLKEPLSAFGAVQYPLSEGSLRINMNCTQSKVPNNETLWYEPDKVVTLVPKFKIKEGMEEPYTALLPKFIDLVKENEGETCIHYGFVGPTEDGYVICREGYVDADGLLYHLENVGDVLNEALQYADIVELQVQGPASELEKLKEPLSAFGAVYYPLHELSIRSKKEICS